MLSATQLKESLSARWRMRYEFLKNELFFLRYEVPWKHHADLAKYLRRMPHSHLVFSTMDKDGFAPEQVKFVCNELASFPAPKNDRCSILLEWRADNLVLLYCLIASVIKQESVELLTPAWITFFKQEFLGSFVDHTIRTPVELPGEKPLKHWRGKNAKWERRHKGL